MQNTWRLLLKNTFRFKLQNIVVAIANHTEVVIVNP